MTELPINTEWVEEMALLQDFQLKHQMAFMLEMDLSKALELLPEGIYPVEVRPGVALSFIGYEHYDAGNILFGAAADEFYELTQFLVVQPDLSIVMPMPRYTFFVLQIASNDKDFIRQERELVKAKSYYTPSLEVQFFDQKYQLLTKDRDGMIQNFQNTGSNLSFIKEVFWGQYFSVMDGMLYVGVWNWEGYLSQHQKSGNVGQIYSHPFFENLDPTDFNDCYMQLMSKPGATIRQRFYKPRALWPV